MTIFHIGDKVRHTDYPDYGVGTVVSYVNKFGVLCKPDELAVKVNWNHHRPIIHIGRGVIKCLILIESVGHKEWAEGWENGAI